MAIPRGRCYRECVLLNRRFWWEKNQLAREEVPHESEKEFFGGKMDRPVPFLVAGAPIPPFELPELDLNDENPPLIVRPPLEVVAEDMEDVSDAE